MELVAVSGQPAAATLGMEGRIVDIKPGNAHTWPLDPAYSAQSKVGLEALVGCTKW
jgi:hypothetical protein